MLFSKKSLGLDITSDRVSFALVSGSVSSPLLEGTAMAVLPAETLRPSLREQNILDPRRLTEQLRSAHGAIGGSPARLSVSLPDTVGRVMILDLENRFKNRHEALDVIRWKLKKSLPFDIADTHLDFQQLRIRESGEMTVLVALVAREVIRQYEDLLVQAGFVPARMEFSTFSLQLALGSRMDLQDDCTVVCLRDNMLGVAAFSDDSLEFIRFKELPPGIPADDNRLFMEINSSLTVYRERYPERIIKAAYCIASPDSSPRICAMLEEITACQPLALEIKGAVRPSDQAPADQAALFPYTAAIGAAMRNL